MTLSHKPLSHLPRSARPPPRPAATVASPHWANRGHQGSGMAYSYIVGRFKLSLGELELYVTFSPTVKPSSHPARPLRFLPSAVHSLTLRAGSGPGSVIHSSQLARLLGTEFWIVQHIGSSQFPLRKCTLEKIPNHKSFSNSSANDLRKSPPKNTSQNRSLSQAGAVRLFLDEAPIEAGRRETRLLESNSSSNSSFDGFPQQAYLVVNILPVLCNRAGVYFG